MNLHLDWCSHEAAKFACENWHYSRCIPKSKLAKVGVWENNEFIGTVIFGAGANNNLGAPYGLKQTECCELVRVSLKSHKAPVSRIVAIAIRFLKKHMSGLRLIVSFADTEQGHHGGIYQAGNWIYAGQTIASDEYFFQGKRWQGRAFRVSFGSHTKYLNRGLKIVPGSRKHRYLIGLDDAMRSKIKSLAQKYPKRVKPSSEASGDQPEQRQCDSDPHAPNSAEHTINGDA